ncbi:MAG: type III-A CRISPR-associated protein Csm2 [Sphingomonadaceae bacterium]
MQALVRKMNLKAPSADLFDTVSEQISRILRPDAGKKQNKRTQVRRFYDELLRFRAALPVAHAPADGADEAFQSALPFIRMLNARAVYASQRKGEGGTLVTPDFVIFFRQLVQQIEDRQTLANACTLFEAVIGFMPPDPGN